MAAAQSCFVNYRLLKAGGITLRLKAAPSG
jgi:hypothetical protein